MGRAVRSAGHARIEGFAFLEFAVQAEAETALVRSSKRWTTGPAATAQERVLHRQGGINVVINAGRGRSPMRSLRYTADRLRDESVADDGVRALNRATCFPPALDGRVGPRKQGFRRSTRPTAT
jgi:4-hydroxyphenylpyruvate dioxygenase-like putative hemolysin